MSSRDLRKFLVLLMLAAPCAFGELALVNGNTLHEWFQQRTIHPESDVASQWYVLGAHDALSTIQQGNKSCIFVTPPDTSPAQITHIVRLYLEKHPETRHYSGASLTLQALRETPPWKRDKEH